MKVSDILCMLGETVGIWRPRGEATAGSSTPGNPGRFTVADKISEDLAPGTLNSILKQSGLKH